MTRALSFNLIDEPWIRVRTLSGLVEERSLEHVLTTASDLRCLAGDLPTQDAAIFRLILATLLGAVRPSFARNQDQALDLWAQWWKAGAFPMEHVRRYLDSIRHRWNLGKC